MKYTINMLSSAYKVKGQGVASAYTEQVSLIKKLNKKYIVYENKCRKADITHFHTVDLKYRIYSMFTKNNSINVGYVHFLPETVDGSLRLPYIARKIFYKYLINFYRSMDKLVTVNPYFIKKLQEYNIPKEKIIYIPNYVSKEKFYKLTNEQISNIKSKYGIAKDKFVVFSVGQLQTRKGVFDFCSIAKRMPNVEFIWAGGFSFGNITDGYNKIRKVVENCPPNVKFLGIVDREEMNSLYNVCDLMFLPSYNELFPMTILEAMNINKPILLRNLEIYNEILFDFYLKGNDNNDFINEILKLIYDEEYYKYAESQSKKGSIFYSEENVSKMWDNFYQNEINSVQNVKESRGVKWLKKLII